MAANAKLALLYTLKILFEQTDETHMLNSAELIDALSHYDCEITRQTLYRNIDLLRQFGFDIIQSDDRYGGYYFGSREFELPELKLLVDAIQSSKFITEKKSRQLIGKIEKLAGKPDRKKLSRSVFIHNRIKSENEAIYYSVDGIQEAMNDNVQIAFQYAEWTVQKKLVSRNKGRRYKVSPWAVSWSDGNYYCIAYDSEAEKIKHYRIDKMLKVEVLREESRVGETSFRDFDLASYSRKTFSMFGGKEERVLFRCRNEFAGIMIDRFGKDIHLIPDGDAYFTFSQIIAVSPQFFGWLAGLGDGIEIRSPDAVREEYYTHLRRILEK